MTLNKFKIHFLIRLILFWMIYFAMFRIVFIVYHHTKIPDGKHSETVMSFIYALRLDLATACAGVMFPYVLWVFQQFFKKRFLHLINLIYNIFFLCFVSILSIVNLKMYGEFGTLLTAKSFSYILHPNEILNFISIWSVMLLLATSAVFAWWGIKGYRRFVTNFSYPIENNIMKWTQIAIIPILLTIACRGGFQQAPINETSATYSEIEINNCIATNNIWYLSRTVLDAK